MLTLHQGLLRFPCPASQWGNLKLGGSRVRTAELARGILHPIEHPVHRLGWAGCDLSSGMELASRWWAMCMACLYWVSFLYLHFSLLLLLLAILYFSLFQSYSWSYLSPGGLFSSWFFSCHWRGSIEVWVLCGTELPTAVKSCNNNYTWIKEIVSNLETVFKTLVF